MQKPFSRIKFLQNFFQKQHTQKLLTLTLNQFKSVPKNVLIINPSKNAHKLVFHFQTQSQPCRASASVHIAKAAQEKPVWRQGFAQASFELTTPGNHGLNRPRQTKSTLLWVPHICNSSGTSCYICLAEIPSKSRSAPKWLAEVKQAGSLHSTLPCPSANTTWSPRTEKPFALLPAAAAVFMFLAPSYL